ncbi:MAG: MFS transporter [Deltaproteobacteria bacterium]|nr:MFS transporter [Deltaproteobacteria bacterium]MBW2019416.1 MFS transporter [Deltaproteobacteria bacterium]MBW2074253.1 MFS transporter [Deltaproteobacteria bacterium]
MSASRGAENRFSAKFQTGQVLTIASGHFIHDVFTSFLAPWLPLLIKKLSLSLTLAGSFTVFLRIPSIFNPVIGIIADRLDMRYMVIAAPAVTAVCMSLIGLAPSYGVVCVLLFIAGLSAAVFHVPGPVMIARVSGSQVGKGMSFFMAAGEFARTVGPLVAVAVVSLWGFAGGYPVMIVGLVASSLLYWRLRHATIHCERRHHSSIVKTWRAMQHILIPLTCLVVARALMVASLSAFLPTFIVAEGRSLWFGGMALALLEFAGVIGTMVSGTLSDRLGRRFVLFAAMTASPILMLMFVMAPVWAVFPVLLLLGCNVFATGPVMLAIVQDHAHGMRATANGIYMGINFLVVSGVTILVGWIGDLLGLRAAFAWGAVLALLGLPVIYFLPRHAGDSVGTSLTE